eukprot:TRINITY_DN493_c1_g1_i1.p1 TRINITY_DN493_c1_g1~~TRINITY_DN493_c1_g1_i1.p1  ORF type:complete len:324 (-),score=55.47 TRINITY_DN493_c1_g1_i1:47-1018(-)
MSLKFDIKIEYPINNFYNCLLNNQNDIILFFRRGSHFMNKLDIVSREDLILDMKIDLIHNNDNIRDVNNVFKLEYDRLIYDSKQTTIKISLTEENNRKKFEKYEMDLIFEKNLKENSENLFQQKIHITAYVFTEHGKSKLQIKNLQQRESYFDSFIKEMDDVIQNNKKREIDCNNNNNNNNNINNNSRNSIDIDEDKNNLLEKEPTQNLKKSDSFINSIYYSIISNNRNNNNSSDHQQNRVKKFNLLDRLLPIIFCMIILWLLTPEFSHDFENSSSFFNLFQFHNILLFSSFLLGIISTFLFFFINNNFQSQLFTLPSYSLNS